MTFPITCPACQATSSGPEPAVGGKITCQQCGHTFDAQTADTITMPPAPSSPANTILYVLLGLAVLLTLAGGGALAYWATSRSQPSAPASPPVVKRVSRWVDIPLANWHEHRAPEGFRVLFPVPPEPDHREGIDDAGVPIEQVLYVAAVHGEKYIATVQHPVPDKGRPHLSLLEAAVERGSENARSDPRNSEKQRQKITYRNCPGWEVQFILIEMGAPTEMIARYIEVKGRILCVIASGVGLNAETPRVVSFFNSLEFD